MNKSSLHYTWLGALVLGMAAWSGGARGSDLADRARRIGENLSSGQSPLTSEQREEIGALLGAVEAMMARADALSGPGACYNEAYRDMSRTEAIQLCEGGGDLETVRCFKEAVRVLASSEARRLCKGGGTIRTALCFQAARRQLSTAKSIELCQERGTEEAVLCYAEAFRQLTSEQALKLCQRQGTLDRARCVSDGLAKVEPVRSGVLIEQCGAKKFSWVRVSN